MGSVKIVHNEQLMRYELYVGGDLASVAEYRPAGGRLDFHHTETDPSFRGRGLAERVVRQALEDVRSRNQRIDPTCWFVADFIDSHPEYQDVLTDENRAAQ